jgi:hypothetical protein
VKKLLLVAVFGLSSLHGPVGQAQQAALPGSNASRFSVAVFDNSFV